MREVLIKIKKGNLRESELENFVEKALEIFGLDNVEISLLFTDDKEIKELNKRFRNKDKPTDVLSFPMGDDIGGVKLLGDIVISVDTAQRQAKEEGISLEDRVKRLIVHGLLHLLGYDHERGKEEEEEFFRLEEEIVDRLKGC